MAPLRNALPPAESAAKIIAEGARARAIVLTEVMAITPPDTPSTAAVIQALALAGQHGPPAYGTIAPYANGDQGSDTPGRQVLGQWGGTTVGTNSTAMVAGVAPANRAAFGAFPHLLGQWVRDDHVLPLAEAIRRITSLPASIFDIPQRGIIREQYFADLVVFDPATVSDRTSDQKPGAYPAGITHVIVNGVVTLTPAGLTGARAGHRLRGFGARRQTR